MAAISAELMRPKPPMGHIIPRRPVVASDMRDEGMTEEDMRGQLSDFVVLRFEKMKACDECDDDGEGVRAGWDKCTTTRIDSGVDKIDLGTKIQRLDNATLNRSARGEIQEATSSPTGRSRQMTEAMSGKVAGAVFPPNILRLADDTCVGGECARMRTKESEGEAQEISSTLFLQRSNTSITSPIRDNTRGKESMDLSRSLEENTWSASARRPQTMCPISPLGETREGSTCELSPPTLPAQAGTTADSIATSAGGDLVTESASPHQAMSSIPSPLDRRCVLNNEPIAIIGSGCRLPGAASSPSELWDLLLDKQDLYPVIPESRFSMNSFYETSGSRLGHAKNRHAHLRKIGYSSDGMNTSRRQLPLRQSPTLPCEFKYITGSQWSSRTWTIQEVVTAGKPVMTGGKKQHLIPGASVDPLNNMFIGDEPQGWIDHVEKQLDPSAFDASFFGNMSAEIQAMDPQQRLLTEVALDAFESAFGGMDFNSRDDVNEKCPITESRMVGAGKSYAYYCTSDLSTFCSSNAVWRHHETTRSTGLQALDRKATGRLGFPASTSLIMAIKTSNIEDTSEVLRKEILMWMIGYNLMNSPRYRGKVTSLSIQSTELLLNLVSAAISCFHIFFSKFGEFGKRTVNAKQCTQRIHCLLREPG